MLNFEIPNPPSHKSLFSLSNTIVSISGDGNIIALGTPDGGINGGEGFDSEGVQSEGSFGGGYLENVLEVAGLCACEGYQGVLVVGCAAVGGDYRGGEAVGGLLSRLQSACCCYGVELDVGVHHYHDAPVVGDGGG